MRTQKELIQAIDSTIQVTEKMIKDQTKVLRHLQRFLVEVRKERSKNE